MSKILNKTLGRIGNLSGETALKQLVGQAAGTLTKTAAPMTAASLEPLIGALLQVGLVVSEKLSDQIVEKMMAGVGEKITDKVVARYADQISDQLVAKLLAGVSAKLSDRAVVKALGQIAGAIANTAAEKVTQQLASKTLVTVIK